MPSLMELHWLPIRSRILFKILVLTDKCLHGMAPTYLSDLLQPKGASIINLRSNTNLNLLAIPRTNLCSSGDHEFATASPKEWNKLVMGSKFQRTWIRLSTSSRHSCLQTVISKERILDSAFEHISSG